MNEEDTEFRTAGQLIEKLLAERDWTQDFLAFWLDVSESTVSKMVSGARPINAETALALGEIFAVDPVRFLRLQQSYDLAKARITAPSDPNKSTKANLFGTLPVSAMIKRNWLENVANIKDIKGVERELKRFFEVAELGDIEILPHSARKTMVVGASNEALARDAQLAWIYRVKKLADGMLVGPYSQISVRRAIKQLQPLMKSVDGIRKVPRVLSEAGIRFVIVETIGPAKIDGVCLWLDDHSPVIGMTLRFDRIDNFWFVLRHEIEHVEKLHGREAVQLDAELEGQKTSTGQDVPEEERLANYAAANFGFTQEYLQMFISRKSPYFREVDIEGFAQTVGVHTGIVVGRLQHATKRYDFHRQHLVSIRAAILQSAVVDGWGHYAPVDYDD